MEQSNEPEIPKQETEIPQSFREKRPRRRTKTVSLRNPNGSMDWKTMPDGRVVILDKAIKEPEEIQ